jgi:membrane-associated phospholipid phosphatase
MEKHTVIDNLFALMRKYPLLIPIAYAMFYFPCFMLLEKVPMLSGYYTVQFWPDEIMPFIPEFVIPYLSWFIMVPLAGVFFLIAERERYFELCFLLFTGMTVCLFIYTVFPTQVMLRQPLITDGFCTDLVRMIRERDTSTNVLPSIHVANTVAVMLVVGRSQVLRAWQKHAVNIWGILICLSTMLIDQHSIADVLCGCGLAFFLLWTKDQIAASGFVQKQIRQHS